MRTWSDDQIIIELEALRNIGGPEVAQVLNYRKASGLSRALLLNVGLPSLEYRRLIRSVRSLKPLRLIWPICEICGCSGWGSNPHEDYSSWDFKSHASASFATRAGPTTSVTI